MCGICGELRLDNQKPDPAMIQTMMDSLARRGPDHEGTHHEGPVALGHRRLSIIDLSARSDQPMLDKELGFSIVFNGTIYNYPELRKELIAKGHQFFSGGDTEVIIKAYAEWGKECVKYLHGMFAFAIWDTKQKTLFLARDRLGIKPLYYASTGNMFRFSSNTQALLKTGGPDASIDTSIDPVGLHHQFTLHGSVPAPHTIFKGIRKLAPGHSLTIDLTGGKPSQKPYWQLKANNGQIKHSEKEWIDLTHTALRKAVERRTEIADVPVGVLLSGGLDSSLLVALLAEAGIKDIRTFSIGFEDIASERGSEFEYSDAVVERYQTQHRKIIIPNDHVLERLGDAVQNMSEPMFGQDAIAFYLLSEQVSKEVKVVQSGQGADELFAGYFWYPQIQDAQGPELERFASNYFDRDHDEYLSMISEKFHGDDYTSSFVLNHFDNVEANHLLDKVLHLDVTTLIVDDPVKRVDNMTMAWGLEARVPFLDHELVELAAQMPSEIKLKSGGKYPLKQIARGILPDEVIDRTKGYFPMPALKYVRGDFLDFMTDILNSDQCRQRGIYNRYYVDKLLAAPEEYFTRIEGSKLWHLALFEYWLQLNAH